MSSLAERTSRSASLSTSLVEASEVETQYLVEYCVFIILLSFSVCDTAKTHQDFINKNKKKPNLSPTSFLCFE